VRARAFACSVCVCIYLGVSDTRSSRLFAEEEAGESSEDARIARLGDSCDGEGGEGENRGAVGEGGSRPRSAWRERTRDEGRERRRGETGGMGRGGGLLRSRKREAGWMAGWILISVGSFALAGERDRL